MAGRNIFLFVPNLIGYARVLLAAAAFYYVADVSVFVWCYMLSAFLDVMDGYAARYLNQSTTFGAVLDMVTDRVATTCLLFVLANLYPQYILAFQGLVALDIISHWMHMYSSVVAGNKTHKSIDKSGNWFLRLYYTSRTVLFLMCAGNELFFVMLYVVYHSAGPIIDLGVAAVPLYHLLAYLTLPVCFVKQGLSVIQLVGAANALADLDRNAPTAAVPASTRTKKSG